MFCGLTKRLGDFFQTRRRLNLNKNSTTTMSPSDEADDRALLFRLGEEISDQLVGQMRQLSVEDTPARFIVMNSFHWDAFVTYRETLGYPVTEEFADVPVVVLPG